MNKIYYPREHWKRMCNLSFFLASWLDDLGHPEYNVIVAHIEKSQNVPLAMRRNAWWARTHVRLYDKFRYLGKSTKKTKKDTTK